MCAAGTFVPSINEHQHNEVRKDKKKAFGISNVELTHYFLLLLAFRLILYLYFEIKLKKEILTQYSAK
jgi:hypothetical protein